MSHKYFLYVTIDHFFTTRDKGNHEIFSRGPFLAMLPRFQEIFIAAETIGADFQRKHASLRSLHVSSAICQKIQSPLTRFFFVLGPESLEPDFVGAPYEFWVGANVAVGTSVGQIRLNDAVKTNDLIYDLLHSYEEGGTYLKKIN